MKRFFGGKKEPPPPPPSLDDATETVNKRVGVLDDKIRALDKQLIDFKNQLKATRPGPAQARHDHRPGVIAYIFSLLSNFLINCCQIFERHVLGCIVTNFCK